jgi:hypothetical protein
MGGGPRRSDALLMKTLKSHFTPSGAMAVALLALLMALSGSAVAASPITSKQIKNGTIQTEDVSKKARKALAAKASTGLPGPQRPQGPKGDQATRAARATPARRALLALPAPMGSPARPARPSRTPR